jgi:hypothetical protein
MMWEPKYLQTEASTGQQLNFMKLSSPFDLNFALLRESTPYKDNGNSQNRY